MKKTLNVNIGSVAFVVDEDAYKALKQYLDDVESRVEEETEKEVMNDLEMRIADILLEELSSPRQVVSIGLVRRTIAIIGDAEEFGERRRGERKKSGEARRLYRSRKDNVIGGVCGGIAEYFNIDVSIVRLLAFIFIFFGGVSLWVYIVLWIVIPMEPDTIDY